MELFSIDLTPGELSLIRQSLDIITITGKDAKFVSNLQIKLESEILQIQQLQAQNNTQKKNELKQLLAAEKKKKQVDL